jgi:uncharacterized protein YdbL (DUF1318 family)
MRSQTSVKMTATEARQWAAQISARCSGCFTTVKAVKQFGRWVININGGRGACYGRTIESVEAAEDTVRIFQD